MWLFIFFWLECLLDFFFLFFFFWVWPLTFQVSCRSTNDWIGNSFFLGSLKKQIILLIVSFFHSSLLSFSLQSSSVVIQMPFIISKPETIAKRSTTSSTSNEIGRVRVNWDKWVHIIQTSFYFLNRTRAANL